jgi:hypothetical protein
MQAINCSPEKMAHGKSAEASYLLRTNIWCFTWPTAATRTGSKQILGYIELARCYIGPWNQAEEFFPRRCSGDNGMYVTHDQSLLLWLTSCPEYIIHMQGMIVREFGSGTIAWERSTMFGRLHVITQLKWPDSSRLDFRVLFLYAKSSVPYIHIYMSRPWPIEAIQSNLSIQFILFTFTYVFSFVYLAAP